MSLRANAEQRAEAAKTKPQRDKEARARVVANHKAAELANATNPPSRQVKRRPMIVKRRLAARRARMSSNG
ncbi:hypothetical protein UFOVP1324_28 [uncultured Caudovirales phage]|uniref:Uncharacterized protein n=1 Tax=uncultured Caudovirales phage TaxID=2100421 RepID=A0A6J5RYD5_9CAUD|nr:hypothetical protein UFOVP1324_28 [uncultured Caudovirales phage]